MPDAASTLRPRLRRGQSSGVGARHPAIRRHRLLLPWVVFLALAGTAQAQTYVPCYPGGAPVTTPTTIFTSSIGGPGHPGAGAGFDGPGHAGQPGGAGASLSYTLGNAANYVALYSEGGPGGEGSNASSGKDGLGGGEGSTGGAAGPVTITTNAAITAGTLPTTGGIPTAAVCAVAVGGTGGQAGLHSHKGSDHPSGPGGSAGTVTVTINSTLDASLVGVLAQAVGGNGAAGKNGTDLAGLVNNGGQGGAGWTGGPVTVTISGSVNASTTPGTGPAAVQAISLGGIGGAGGNGTPDIDPDDGNGGTGGTGGAGGTVTVTISGTVTAGSPGVAGISGVLATSIGGAGGAGGNGYNDTDKYKAGAGGPGGVGGEITVTGTGSVSTASPGAPAVLATSSGGIGGLGGTVGQGGNGGAGANGGPVNVTMNATITTAANDSAGILAQSFGGQGAVGGAGTDWTDPKGGAGGSGGDGGMVTVQGSNMITTGAAASPTSNASGIVAQSVGGGGGSGGDALDGDFQEIGGRGGAAANGQGVMVNIGNTIITTGDRSNGVLAQSIGGGGGNGGNASGSGEGINVTIGGSGAGGGSGGALTIHSDALIQTAGGHSAGLLLQSIGGGGGNGGAAYGSVSGKYIAVQVSLGGTGGGGGGGGSIGLLTGQTETNDGVIATTGPDSAGILAQSIGGGGGAGGPSGAQAVARTNSQYPGVSLTISNGGSGGGGLPGGSVSVGNGGMIATSGAGSRGLTAQSIGGGGGDAGASDATSKAAGQNVAIGINITHGGSGGAGGAGGAIPQANNTGLIVTTGGDSDALLAQSIGGGGGAGGGGDGHSGAGSITLNVTLGGSGGSGGAGGAVTAGNNGGILTLGDGASGITAQAIGGGGGRAGGGAGGSASAGFSATLLLGGSAGSGGSNGTNGAVLVGNGGPVLTFGADAPGIVAQSIGGGGGIAGKGATSIGSGKSTGDGGNGVGTAGPALASLVAQGEAAVGSYQDLASLVGLANTLLGNGSASVVGAQGLLGDLLSLGASGGTNAPVDNSPSVAATVSLGGRGGAGGSGGQVTVTNSSDIATTGRMSDGILAQSIGGGGGKGGVANTALTSASVSGAITVGGNAGDGGNGGAVMVTNAAGATVTTIGGVAPGIVAQSIGGGGGAGGAAGSSQGLLSPNLSTHLAFNLGGNGSGGGTANAVTVWNLGSVTTSSHDAPGIIAQSIGGGGGILKALASDVDTGGGQVVDGGVVPVAISIAGAANTCAARAACNDSIGAVTVNSMGSVQTSGKDAYGIVAQSIGGGGGLMLGGRPLQSSVASFFAGTAMTGDANAVNVTVAGPVATSGRGAFGIIAQSIGGGGIFAGDPSSSAALAGFVPIGNHSGAGGPVTVTVDSTGSVITNADHATAIFAQSIGGSGGRITTESNAVNGWAGGVGTGQTVSITVNGYVQAGGAAAAGVYAASTGTNGTAGSVISVTVGPGAAVYGGNAGSADEGGAPAGAGIIVDSGSMSSQTPNTVSNFGTISSDAGVAIVSRVGYLAVTNQSTGVIEGSIILDETGNSGSCTGSTQCPVSLGATRGRGEILNRGLIQARSIRLGGGMLTNAGTLDMRGGGGPARLDGDLHAVAGSTLRIGADFTQGTSDLLVVTGTAILDAQSTLQVDVAAWRKGSVPVLAAGTLVQAPPSAQASNGAYLFGLRTVAAGNTLEVQAVSNLRAAARGLSATQQGIAASLEQIWDAGAGFDTGIAALASVPGAAAYRSSLTSLAGATVGGIVAVRQAASESFADRLTACDTLGDASADTRGGPGGGNCAWLRVMGDRTSLASQGDDPGFQQNALTYQIGGQTEFAPGWFAGASIGHESSWLTGSGDGASVAGESALFGVMLKRQSGPWELTGVVGGGYGWYTSQRQIVVGSLSGTATGEPSVAHVGLYLRAAYAIALDDWQVKPSMSVGMTYRHLSGYAETGTTPFNQAVQSGGDTVGNLSPMVELSRATALRTLGTLRGFVAVGAAFYVNNDWTTQASFQLAPAGTGGFSATSHLPDAAGRIVAGFDLFSAGSVQAKLSYGATLAPGYAVQSLTGRLVYNF
ncbi:MAG: autotransporter outer membrane beta-barrel domain-containing protein [Acetobacteraceae bacterium]